MTQEEDIAEDSVIEYSITTLGCNTFQTESTHIEYSPSQASKATSAPIFVRSPRTRNKKAIVEIIPEEITTKMDVSKPITSKGPGLLLGTNVAQSFKDNSPEFGNTPDNVIL